MRRHGLLAVLFLAALSIPRSALGDSCIGLCTVDCVRPISIQDRWDDFSVSGSVNWSGNGVWDSEQFTDSNGNGIWDPGEPFVDGSSKWTLNGHGPINGTYDAEHYDPLNTGYVFSRDVGLQISLVPAGATPSPTSYYPVYVPSPIPIGVGDEYSWNWSNCSVPVSIGDRLTTESGNMAPVVSFALRTYILHDSGASWSDSCQCVMSALGDQSPRLIVFPAQDPRLPLSAGGQPITVKKWVGFFLESADAFGRTTGRLVQVHRTGSNSCAIGGDFIVDCAVPTHPVTWGAVKGIYR